MRYLDFQSDYDKTPTTRYRTSQDVYAGLKPLLNHITSQASSVIALETYPGVDVDTILAALSAYKDFQIIDMRSLSIGKEAYLKRFKDDFTDDRVFGIKTTKTMADIFQNLPQTKPLTPTIIVGFGAALYPHDVLYYGSIHRYEHQLRMRQGQPNYLLENNTEDILTKYKVAYFVEWVIANQHKRNLLSKIDYFIEWNDIASPKMVSFEVYQDALKRFTNQPFRLVPYFDPGVWGGQWMKEVCQLNPHEKNYAWSFDGVVEENSLRLLINDVLFDVPAQDLIDLYPAPILGPHVFEHFQYNLPIRFDLLDTMEGQNLSLQVHPTRSYIKTHFNMPYTQDESYYILDALEDGAVYLGFKEAIHPEAFEAALRNSESTQSFEALKYVNVFPVKKHDHLLIPAGTIHCSGQNTMVLEISAAAYIFTFKLWDWNRLGLDGKMRPVHIEHGLKNLDYSKTTQIIQDHHINTLTVLDEHLEKTGLDHETFLDSYRLSFKGTYRYTFAPTVQMANLVSGQKMMMRSMSGAFEPLEIHYAETFIIPAQVQDIEFECLEECKVVFAEVNPSWSNPSY